MSDFLLGSLIRKFDAGAFYIGGSLEYDASNKLVYQAGRGAERDNCLVMAAPGDCKQHEFAYTTISNSKVFLLGAVGLVCMSCSGINRSPCIMKTLY